MENDERRVLKGLSNLVYKELRTAAQEQRYPGHDPDRMDEIISDALDKAKAYRRLREEFENTCTGALMR